MSARARGFESHPLRQTHLQRTAQPASIYIDARSGQNLTAGPKVKSHSSFRHRGSTRQAQPASLDLRSVHPGSSSWRQPTGHLVYGVAGTLRTLAFDLGRLGTRGTPLLGQRIPLPWRAGPRATDKGRDSDPISKPAISMWRTSWLAAPRQTRNKKGSPTKPDSSRSAWPRNRRTSASPGTMDRCRPLAAGSLLACAGSCSRSQSSN